MTNHSFKLAFFKSKLFIHEIGGTEVLAQSDKTNVIFDRVESFDMQNII